MTSIHIDESTAERIDVSLGGDLDADAAPALVRRVLGARLPGADVFVMTSGVGFIDSSGISAFLRINAAVTSDGGSFRLLDPSPAVRRLMDIAGLTEVFGID